MTEVPTLTTQRFTLRPLQPSDAAALYPTLSDPDHCRYLSHPPFESEAQLWGWLAEPDWPGRSWIAVDQQTRVAGRFVAVPTHDEAIAEIGYIVTRDHLRQGVARECAAALIDHLITAENMRKITADIDIRNPASIALIEALGFTREAHLREHEITHSGLCDLYVYGLLACEWSAQTSGPASPSPSA